MTLIPFYRQGHLKKKLEWQVAKNMSVGENLHFSTKFSTTFQWSFIVENITFNYKMFFVTKKCIYFGHKDKVYVINK
jgi:hypothetical protein